jgi:hypothetical protein
MENREHIEETLPHEVPFVVGSDSPALGKRCQHCLEKIKLGDRAKRIHTVGIGTPKNVMHFEHADACESPVEGNTPFKCGVGGGVRVIRSTKALS